MNSNFKANYKIIECGDVIRNNFGVQETCQLKHISIENGEYVSIEFPDIEKEIQLDITLGATGENFDYLKYPIKFGSFDDGILCHSVKYGYIKLVPIV